MKKLNIKNVVFAGGGSRCIWQVGFYNTVESALKIKPVQIAGVSAGSAMACMIFSGNADMGINYFKEITAVNKKNFYPGNLFSSTPAFPHYRMYRDVIIKTLNPQGFKRLMKGPEIKILIARPPVYLGPRSATFAGIVTYTLEKTISHPVHPVYASRVGFRPCIETAQSCSTPDELADLILSSSCTPPFVPVMRWKDIIALDGGLIDNVPVVALDNDEMTLIMLTRMYKQESIPVIKNRIYVQPSEPVPVSKWDYTNPSGVQKAYDLGRRDAEKFLSGLKSRDF